MFFALHIMCQSCLFWGPNRALNIKKTFLNNSPTYILQKSTFYNMLSINTKVLLFLQSFIRKFQETFRPKHISSTLPCVSLYSASTERRSLCTAWCMCDVCTFRCIICGVAMPNNRTKTTKDILWQPPLNSDRRVLRPRLYSYYTRDFERTHTRYALFLCWSRPGSICVLGRWFGAPCSCNYVHSVAKLLVVSGTPHSRVCAANIKAVCTRIIVEYVYTTYIWLRGGCRDGCWSCKRIERNENCALRWMSFTRFMDTLFVVCSCLGDGIGVFGWSRYLCFAVCWHIGNI